MNRRSTLYKILTDLKSWPKTMWIVAFNQLFKLTIRSFIPSAPLTMLRSYMLCKLLETDIIISVMIEISYKFYVFLFHNPTIFPTYIKRTLQFPPASRTPDLCPCGGMSSSDQSLQYQHCLGWGLYVKRPCARIFGQVSTYIWSGL